MIAIIALCLSILVILAGMYLLSKSKKESLGNFYLFSSYSAIILGALLFAGTVIGGVCMRHCQGGKQGSCYSQGYDAKCGNGAMGGHCMSMCKSGGAGQCASMGGGMCHGGGAMACSQTGKMGKCGGMKHHEMMIEVHSDDDEGDENEDESEEETEEKTTE